MATPDALRSSLDSHQVDRKAGRDREYVESALRRIEAQHGGKTRAHYGEGVVANPTDDTPSFDRVKPVAHPRQTKDTELSPAAQRKLLKEEKRTAKKGQVLELDFGEDEVDKARPVAFSQVKKPAPNQPQDDYSEPKEVEVQFKEIIAPKIKRQAVKPRASDEEAVWNDVTEGEDPALKPDPEAGYMKGKYALFRRDVDGDHAVYFFATEVAEDAEQARIPQGYEVRLTDETRLPYIARSGKADHLNRTEHVRARDRDQAIDIAARKGIGGIHSE